MSTPRPWIDLIPVWAQKYAAAEKVWNAKRDLPTTRAWTDCPPFAGFLGDEVVGVTMNLKPNTDLLVGGDGGWDFPDIDVKTDKAWKDPWLKQPIKDTNRPARAAYFVLVALDMAGRRGRIVGWCDIWAVFAAKPKLFLKAAGPQYAIHHPDLLDWPPPNR